MEEVQTAILSALSAILVALIGVITKKVVAFLNEKGVTEKLNKKRYLVDLAVNAIEQIYQNEEGEVKLKKAKQMILSLFNDNGLSITETELDALIEASVKAMNDAFNSTKVGMIELKEEK
ncbi:phage holin, LLH family [Pisciglobus halotolerans]|uniref:Bacteriophage holin of superfamily 6 (Holin_LLH) n=1 Tax=Pisciglobus halotolerans TaxID=745365 RepID=A0A1I3C2T5_9LACT|nr:phage holin, LLH family [Pisciglobus halotolerans]SFH68499.1 Bacteriophage holin of superfamily 6 (Holin_LLH) [Pisciglobus halotolerans]